MNWWETCACSLLGTATHHISSGEDDGQAEGRDDDARREEDGQLLAGVAGRVCVVHHPPRDAVRDGAEDVEKEQEQRPVFAADAGEKQRKGAAAFNRVVKTLRTMKDYQSYFPNSSIVINRIVGKTFCTSHLFSTTTSLSPSQVCPNY